MANQRSNIEVFFRALGHNQVRQALRSIARDAERTARDMQSNGRAGADGFRDLANAARASDRRLSAIGRNSFGRAGVDWAGQIGDRLRSSVGSALSLGRAIGGTALGAVGRLAGGVVDLTSLLGRAAVAAAGIGAATAFGAGRAINSIRETTDELGGMVLALRAVNREVDRTNAPRLQATPTGLADAFSGRKTAEDLEYLNRVAHEHGLVLTDISGTYVKLKAAAVGANLPLNTIRETFDGVADMSVVFGLPQAQVDRAMTALSQIAGKGQLYSEELKGQLGEALPDAIGLTARAFGVSVKELNKLMEDGAISSDEFFRRFSRQVQIEYGEAARSMAGTTRVAVGQLRNAWQIAKATIGSGTLDVAIGRLVRSITRLLQVMAQNGSLQRFGAALAATLDRVSYYIESFGTDTSPIERALQVVARGFDRMVRAGLRTMRMLGSLVRLFDEAMRVLRSGQMGASPAANFLAALASAAIEAGRALSTIAIGPAIAQIGSFSAMVQSAANWLGQLGFALRSLYTGQAQAGLDATGTEMLINLAWAVNLARSLGDEIAVVWAWLREIGPEVAAIIGAAIAFFVENKDVLKAAAEGIADALRAIVDVARAIGDALTFVGLDTSVGYAVGLLYMLNKLLPVGRILAGVFTGIAALLGVSSLALFGWIAAIAAIGVGLYAIWQNWDAIWTGIKGGFKLIVAGLAEFLASLIEKIPGVGAAIARKLREGAAGFRDQAQDDAYQLTMRQMERQRAEPPQQDSRWAQVVAGYRQADRQGLRMSPEMQRAAMGATDPREASNDNTRGYGRPVQIILQDGTVIDLRARNHDTSLDALAARQARNRAAQAPAWGG